MNPSTSSHVDIDPVLYDFLRPWDYQSTTFIQ